MYKIYINEVAVKLVRSEEIEQEVANTESVLLLRYTGKVKFLMNVIDMCEKNSQYDEVVIYSKDYQKLKADFKSLGETVKAGGGIVENDVGKFLFIFRRGHWDLPKGKLEDGETKKEGAVREVEEETGVSGISLHKKVAVTNHLYRLRNGKRAIKKSYWYYMTTHDQGLIPQTEEDIERAEWMSIEEFRSLGKPVYNNIVDVVDAYEKYRSGFDSDRL